MFERIQNKNKKKRNNGDTKLSNNTQIRCERRSGRNVGEQFVLAAFVLLILTSGVLLTGCGKKTANIQVLQYQVNEDETITITGLTDKGKSDATITIPSTIDGKQVVSIENEAFRDDDNVTKVVIEEGITKIGENTFLSCNSLAEISFPSTITDIGTNAVKDSLWEQNMLEQNSEVIINHILVYVNEDGSSYQIPDGVTMVASGTFYGKSNLTRVTCPDSLVRIGTYAFADCTNLTDIELSDQLTEIGYYAFSECTELELNIPESVTTIATDAFLNVKKVTVSTSIQGAPWGAKEIQEL